jgi:hypothetical protein
VDADAVSAPGGIFAPGRAGHTPRIPLGEDVARSVVRHDFRRIHRSGDDDGFHIYLSKEKL